MYTDAGLKFKSISECTNKDFSLCNNVLLILINQCRYLYFFLNIDGLYNRPCFSLAFIMTLIANDVIWDNLPQIEPITKSNTPAHRIM